MSELDKLLRVYPIVWVVGEPLTSLRFAIQTLTEMQRRNEKPAPTAWTAYTGAYPSNETPTRELDPDAAVDLINVLANADGGIILADELDLKSPILQHAALRAVSENRPMVFVSSREPEDFISDYLRVYKHDEIDLDVLVRENCDQNERGFREELLDPLRGLRKFRATGTLLESFLHTQEGDELPYLKAARKEGIHKDSANVIVYHEAHGSFDELIGLNRAKILAKGLAEAAQAGEDVRGMMLVGVQGCGKTKLVEMLSGETRMDVLEFDLGTAFDPYVGKTEYNTRRAIEVLNGLPSSIVMLDELEKMAAAVSTSAAQGDSGTGRRSGRYLLEFLNAPKSSTGCHFVVATCNNLTLLPPEFTRAGRFDVTVAFPLPSVEQLKGILQLYRRKHKLPKTFGMKADLAGMTGAEVEACCRIARILKLKTWDDSIANITLLSKSRKEEIRDLENWMAGRAILADDTGSVSIDSLSDTHRRVRK